MGSTCDLIFSESLSSQNRSLSSDNAGRTINATVAEVKGGTAKQMTDADLRTKLELAGGNPAIIDLIIAGDGSRNFRFAHVLETMT